MSCSKRRPPFFAIPLFFAFFLSAGAARPSGPPGPLAWQEQFDHPPLGWVDPFGNPPERLARVYHVDREGPLHFLRARYDGTTSPRLPAMHFGKAFQHRPAPLSRVRALRWKWRVVQHPKVSADPWIDCAASLYVIIRQPSLLHGGRGFKLAWLAAPGATGKRQHGLAEYELRHDPATAQWQSESVDLCALYKKEYGAPCEGESVLYVGVMTDGDNTRSVAAADYSDFELELMP